MIRNNEGSPMMISSTQLQVDRMMKHIEHLETRILLLEGELAKCLAVNEKVILCYKDVLEHDIRNMKKDAVNNGYGAVFSKQFMNKMRKTQAWWEINIYDRIKSRTNNP